ncbi:hypothetical protein BJX66DRAFT_61738 [Aspergillus keveii]|uniref:GPI inositol-deacylase n=1 Tax=Aspergillus keveii TaxID=714993 RepID=A0ABR4FQJ0_9EURO
MFKKLGRSRQDAHQDSSAASSAPDLPPVPDEDEGQSLPTNEPRRASEPLLSTRSATVRYRDVSSKTLPPTQASSLPQRKASSSGYSFLSLGSRRSGAGDGRNPSSTQPDPLGLTLLSDCAKPCADLIFVHGLGGSSLRTWSYNRDVERCWLPWLAAEAGFSNTRVFTFGYSAHYAQDSPALSILDFAKDLLFQIRMYQDAEREDFRMVGEHPIIFVVHSMGGLVVKKAYIIGKTDRDYSPLMSQTYGIVFLGTPHRGSNMASILNTILRTSILASAKVFVGELEKGSTALDDINEQFRHLCGDLQLISFHETLKTVLAPGVKTMVVEKESAVLGYPTETSAPLIADHHGLTKFPGRQDRNYRDVKNVLRRLVNKVKELRTPQRELTKSYGAPTEATLSEILGVKQVGDELESFRQRIYPGTCAWILQKQSFLDWVGNRSTGEPSILWLVGLPATGKTTLASYIIDYLSQEEVPGSCQYHFFQAERHDTRTVSWFLRSLAFQIGEQNEWFHSQLLQLHRETGILLASQKYNLIWDKVFEGLLFRLQLAGPLYWVVDGLDEVDSPATLASLILKVSSETPIKVLLVSRQSKDLLAALSAATCPVYREEIRIQDTEEDIMLVVDTSLSQALPVSDERQTIIQEVLSKSSGSFLWVRLALNKIKDNWHTKHDIERTLTEMPEGMEFMYEKMSEMITRQPAGLRKMATEILTWATCSFRPLDMDELAAALRPKFGTFLNLGVTIAQICGHFIAVENSKVTLIHQTARQFLLAKHSALPLAINSRAAHEHIAIVCINFLSDTKWRSRLAELGDANAAGRASSRPKADVKDPFHIDPFLLYATGHWAYHVHCGPAGSEELQAAVFDFLEHFALVWIHAVATLGKLQVITQSAQYLKAYGKRVAHHLNQSPPTSLRLGATRDHADLQRWATDLIHVVSRFGANLLDSPSSIYRDVIPFCPPESMVAQSYRHTSRSPMSVIGISSGTWTDCLARLAMGGDEIASKIICADRFFLVLLGSSGTIVVWHAETCAESHRLHHGEWVTRIKASRVKGLVASAGIRTVRLWEIATGQVVCQIPKSSQGHIMALEFTADDSRLLIAYDDCAVHCVNLQTLEEEWCFHVYDPAAGSDFSCPRFMVFSHDAKRIALAQRGRPVYVWSINQQHLPPQQCVRREDLYKREGDVWSAPEVVVWQPESPNVLILYQDTTLVEWNLDDDTQTEHAHIGAREMVISYDGSLLLTSNHNGTLSVWSTGEFRLVYQVKYDEFVRDIAWAPDGQRFYDVRGSLCNVWEPDALIRSDDATREDSSTHDTLYSDPVLSSDNNSRVQISALVCGDRAKYYCTGKEDGTVTIYELETAQKLRKLYGHSNTVSVIELAWSVHQKYIASADDSGRVIAKRLERPGQHAPKKWSVYPLIDQRFGSTITQLLFSPSEDYLLISSAGVDRLWSTKTKKSVFQVERRGRGPRQWVQHPEHSGRLICIEGESQFICDWSTLEEATPSARQPSSPKQPDIPELAIDETLSPNLSELADLSIAEDPHSPSAGMLENVFQVRGRYIILEYRSSHGFFNPRSGSNKSSLSLVSSPHRIELLDLHEDRHALAPRRILPQLSEKVNQAIGVFQGRLVFLDYDYWMCTWDFAAAEDRAYRRHFFLPKDWLATGSMGIVVLDQFGTLLCPRNGEVAIVRSGFRF